MTARQETCSYGPSDSQTLDVHYDDEVSGRPWVLLLHAGSWRGGSRDQFADSIDRWSRAGFVAVAADYRLSQEAVWPAQHRDAVAALEFVRARAGQFGVNPDRVAAVGCSAGGHIALTLGTADRGRDAVAAVVTMSAPTSPNRAWRDGRKPGETDSHRWLGEAAEQLHGGPPTETEPARWGLWRSSDVRTRLDAGDAPSLLIHHIGDPVVPMHHSTDYWSAALDAGVNSELVLFPGHLHGAQLLGDWGTWPVILPWLADLLGVDT